MGRNSLFVQVNSFIKWLIIKKEASQKKKEKGEKTPT